MRRYSPAALLLFFLFTRALFCQDNGSRPLLTVNGHQITADEFEWVYLKNNSGQGESSVDEYLRLYIDFRLKVEAALDAGIDKRPGFTTELEGYRKQLARNYLTDQGAKEELIRKAYERYREEINAYHVLVRCPLDASPADTLQAWQKAMKIRERIRLGEPFESVAKGASDDPNASINGGNLGYFTVFQTPISFENAVYSMSPGALSRPVRTSSGYHIIKVQDRRKSNGRIRVAHIMKAVPQGSLSYQREKARQVIDSLYNLADKGYDFATLARDNSDDIASAKNGGELPWFGSGEMIMDFSEAAFALLHDGDVSPPVQTIYGWHIIKRLEKRALPSFEDSRMILEGKLNQSFLLSLSRKSFAEKLKKEYKFTVNRELLEWFYSIADSSFIAGNYNSQKGDIPDATLYSFAGVSVNAAQFMDFIRQKGFQSSATDSVGFINSLFEIKSYDDLVSYEDNILESKYPDFRYLMNEFHDGILLFEISDSLIWKRASTDTAGLKDFYEERKEQFAVPASASAVIYNIDKRLGKKRVARLTKTIRKNSNDQSARELILASAISGRDTLVSITEGSWQKGENPILGMVRWSRGFHGFSDNKSNYIVDITEIRDSGYMDFGMVKDQLTNDYLKYLEAEWLKQLRSKYRVIVDEKELNTLKEKLKGI